MEGGPGGPGLPSAQMMVAAGLNHTRDVIVVGQRGTRYAEPALMCPEVDALLPQPLGHHVDRGSHRAVVCGGGTRVL